MCTGGLGWKVFFLEYKSFTIMTLKFEYSSWFHVFPIRYLMEEGVWTLEDVEKIA